MLLWSLGEGLACHGLTRAGPGMRLALHARYSLGGALLDGYSRASHKSAARPFAIRLAVGRLVAEKSLGDTGRTRKSSGSLRALAFLILV